MAPDTTLLIVLRERILRRIMRVACGAGVLALLAGVLFIRPMEVSALIIGAIAVTGIFLVTFLPPRLGIVSMVYPWVMVCVSGAIALVRGPVPDPFLLAAGALFIGSLALGTRHLAFLGGCVLLLGGALSMNSPISAGPGGREIWFSSLMCMIAVVVPAVIAGKMVVAALVGALHQREALVRRLTEEIQAREQALRALESTRMQLTHAQKMELIGQMAGGIAHDMNNALTVVMGTASLLGDQVGEDRDRILEAAEHASKLTRQIMVFGRRDLSMPRPVDLVVSLREIQKAIKSLIPSEITLSTDFAPEPIVVVADPTQLLQVLLNLAGNAKDAMVGGGRLTLRLRRDRETKSAIIEVSDTGAGIPDSVMPRIFDPFFTTKPPGEGTGLGLANVKQILDAMGGGIEVRSRIGEGTTFAIRIPASESEIRLDDGTVAKTYDRTGTVLVVDDDVRVRSIVFTTLGRIGYQVLEAATPEVALSVALAHPGQIDILLTDVVMSGGGGAAVIEKILGRFPGTRVLVMSGYNDSETLRRGISQGDFPFIAKPFTAQALAQAVGNALAARPDPAG